MEITWSYPEASILYSTLEKKQGKTRHKSAGSARIKKYLDKQLVIRKAKLLAPTQKSNYSHLGTEKNSQPDSPSFTAALGGYTKGCLGQQLEVWDYKQ